MYIIWFNITFSWPKSKPHHVILFFCWNNIYSLITVIVCWILWLPHYILVWHWLDTWEPLKKIPIWKERDPISQGWRNFKFLTSYLYTPIACNCTLFNSNYKKKCRQWLSQEKYQSSRSYYFGELHGLNLQNPEGNQNPLNSALYPTIIVRSQLNHPKIPVWLNYHRCIFGISVGHEERAVFKPFNFLHRVGYGIFWIIFYLNWYSNQTTYFPMPTFL